jgi:hypothetical protein
MKFSFIQDWGIFRNETFVCVGMTRMEILLEMKRQEFRKDAITAFEMTFRPKDDDPAAMFVWVDEGISLLWMADWRVDLEHYGDLVHETNHLVFEVGKDVGFREELEANAYTQQYLWLNIIKRLNERLGVKSKRNKRKHASEDSGTQRVDGGVQGLHTRVQTEGAKESTPEIKQYWEFNSGRVYPKASRGRTRGRRAR